MCGHLGLTAHPIMFDAEDDDDDDDDDDHNDDDKGNLMCGHLWQ